MKSYFASDVERKKYIDKIIKFLSKQKDKYIKLRHIDPEEQCRGFWVTNNSEIVLDISENIISTLLHEAVHAINPEMAEDTVAAIELELINCITPSQARKLLKCILNGYKISK